MRGTDRRSLADLRRRLINQLDQKTGPEKRILRRTILEIEARQNREAALQRRAERDGRTR